MMNTLPKNAVQEHLAKYSHWGNETVLLVDDEPMVRNMVSQLLCSAGFTVLEAANGVEALEIIKSHSAKSIDIMISDISMPQMGGQKLALSIKELRPDTKVLFTSGYDYDDCNLIEPALVAAGFLQKPYTIDKLFATVRETLDN